MENRLGRLGDLRRALVLAVDVCASENDLARVLLAAPVPSSPCRAAAGGVRRRNAGDFPGFAAAMAARALPRHAIASASRRG